MAPDKNISRLDPVLDFFLRYTHGSSSAVLSWLESRGDAPSVVTVKRRLSALVKEGALETMGAGRATTYKITIRGRLTADIEPHEFCSGDPDRRFGLDSYNHDLFRLAPERIMTNDERRRIDEATSAYSARLADMPEAIHRKELERFVIELSWKSSKIEGNTYTLLDTERLLRDGIVAAGRTSDETAMILCHKTAFRDVLERRAEYATMTRQNLVRLHSLLTEGQGIGSGLRKTLVGITGSKYRPLDNVFQIEEAVTDLAAAVARLETPAEKALFALLGISYIQPFEDGNKRTARLMANAILLAHGLSPLSYRSVDEEDYREAILVFYETNSLVPFKRIFVEQYEFAANNYTVS